LRERETGLSRGTFYAINTGIVSHVADHAFGRSRSHECGASSPNRQPGWWNDGYEACGRSGACACFVIRFFKISALTSLSAVI